MEKRFDKRKRKSYNTHMDTLKDESKTVTPISDESFSKEDALRHLDEKISQKIAEKAALSCDTLDDTLAQISFERKQQREILHSLQKEKKTANDPKSKEETPQGDLRLDSFIDKIISRIFLAYSTIKIKTKTKTEQKMETVIEAVKASERALSSKAAEAVDLTDAWVDCIFAKIVGITRKISRRWRFFRHWSERHKRELLRTFTGAVAIAAAAAVMLGNLTAYEYMYNGRVLGIVKDQQDVFMTVDVIGEKLGYVYDADIYIDKETNISFRKILGWKLEIDDKDKVLNTLTYLRDMKATAYAIRVDGRQVAILNNKKEAEIILDSIKDRFLKKSNTIEYKSVGFAEDVKIEEVSTKIGDIDNKEKVMEFMMTGAVEKKIHAIAPGETFNVIAKNYGLTPEELQMANPEANPDKLQIGQELVLNQIRPVLTVETTEIATYMAGIDYEVEYQETAVLYKGEQTVKSRGIDGKKEVVAEIVRQNGTEVARNELSVKIVSIPVAQVVLKGTKPLPPLIGTGTFIYPTRGTLTSRFGTRWGRMHYGIDLAAPTGTKIRASDGGKVIFSGWDGALGYAVRIDHGGNRVTVYAHCSKLLVKAGDKIYQDQHIANVGNTGNSTGPHVHFEVRINGVAQNPLKYLK